MLVNPVWALRTVQDHRAAARLLREANNPPSTPQAQAAFRARWLPWLAGRASGPVTPRTDYWVDDSVA